MKLVSLWIAGLLVSYSTTATAQRVLSEGVKDLATQIATSVARQQQQKIAVIPFRELDGRATVLGTYVAEALVTNLVNTGSLDVVERTMLDRILAELKLGESGLIDPNSANGLDRLQVRLSTEPCGIETYIS